MLSNELSDAMPNVRLPGDGYGSEVLPPASTD